MTRVATVPEFAPRYRAGDAVRVRRAAPPGHMRTPWYIRGQAGVVERLCGTFGNPEELAYNRSGEPRQPLYRIRFGQAAVWRDYAGPERDTIDVEIYQHWLEPVEPASNPGSPAEKAPR
ncbi:MAG: nitrile hydratase subunit beta [Alphaproteobacteria bacterium]|nr:nitrile hydratase subunit beta [Alphaproteobacteria bacterium]